MHPIRVKICLGTTCYVMGASELQSLAQQLPEDLKGAVSVEGATCLGHCKDRIYGKAPYAVVDGTVVSGATPEILVECIRKRLAELKG